MKSDPQSSPSPSIPHARPRVLADGPLAPLIMELLADQVEIVPWQSVPAMPGDAMPGDGLPVDAIYTYGHPSLDARLLSQLSGVRVISNYGVGVDHIDLRAAAALGIPVGNTPGILDGATADMAFTLLLGTARRLVEGDCYARSPEFTVYDPGYMLGREVHGRSLGIIGLGRIGEQVAKRALGFEMCVSYYNRRRNEQAEQRWNLQYRPMDQLLEQSDFVVLCVPLTAETHGLIGKAQLDRMQSTAILINVARGPVVDTDALTAALAERRIYAAGLDVTDPEPLPRDHPLLKLPNVVIAPHLGSATEETRRKMAEISIANLFLGLQGEPLLHQVRL